MKMYMKMIGADNSTEKDKKICDKYSAYDETGHNHCKECPLREDIWYWAFHCKASSHYDRKDKEWVFDG